MCKPFRINFLNYTIKQLYRTCHEIKAIAPLSGALGLRLGLLELAGGRGVATGLCVVRGDGVGAGDILYFCEAITIK